MSEASPALPLLVFPSLSSQVYDDEAVDEDGFPIEHLGDAAADAGAQRLLPTTVDEAQGGSNDGLRGVAGRLSGSDGDDDDEQVLCC